MRTYVFTPSSPVVTVHPFSVVVGGVVASGGAVVEGEVVAGFDDGLRDDFDGFGLFVPVSPSSGAGRSGTAGGGVGPVLAGMTRGNDEFLAIVREGRGQMPAIGPRDVSDEHILQIAEYLRSLGGR